MMKGFGFKDNALMEYLPNQHNLSINTLFLSLK